MHHTARTSFIAVITLALSTTACLGDGTVQDTYGIGVGAACVVNADCNPGLECEREHGSATCQPHRAAASDGGSPSATLRVDAAARMPACATNADCPSGLECNVEHGVATCVPHRSAGLPASTPSSDGGAAPDSGSPDSGPSDSGSSAGAPAGSSCALDTECAAGLECDVEHGVGVCAPHGGGRR